VVVHTITFRQARALVPAAIPLLAATPFGSGTTTLVVLVIGVTLLSVAFAGLTWRRFSYLDGPTSMVVTRGLITRSVRTVPNDRIRGVEIETPLMHRLFGLVRVRIDAAAGSLISKDEEIVVDGVSPAEGDRLRAAVLTQRAAPVPGGAGEAAPEAAEEEFARFDNRWLLYAPLVGSYLALPAAAVGGLWRLLDEVPGRLQPDLDGPDLADTAVVAVVVAGALLVLAVGSVIGAALVNWGFRLVRRGGSLVAVRGLVTRRHTELEIDRIRGAALSEGAAMRLVRAARVSALVTGLADAARRGQLLPFGPRAEAWRLARRLVDDPGALVRHPPAARRRRLVRATATGLLVTALGIGATIAAGWWWVLAAGIGLTVLGVPLGLGRYASLGHVAGPTSFSVRSGWLVREQVILQHRAVVGWRVQQSFFQRRAGLATVVACVGAGADGYSAVDLAAADVAPFTATSSEQWARTFTAPS
jgi:putative membrane protein